MTQEQREKLFEIMGEISGLTWGVKDQQISEGFCGVVEDLAKLLEEDETARPKGGGGGMPCSYVPMVGGGGGSGENA